MNLQQHERIAQIKKLSGYMYIALRWMSNWSLLIWLFVVLSAFMSLHAIAGVATGYSLNLKDEFYYGSRVAALILGSVNMFFIIKVIRHFRDVMKCFHQGEIFNGSTVFHARHAVFNALIVWGLHFLIKIAFWLAWLVAAFPEAYVSKMSKGLGFKFISSLQIGYDIFWGLMFFGLMYLLLWALEIGRDLNEESELTI